MRTTPLRPLAAVLTLLLLATPGAASAGTRSVDDADDAGGRLDVATATAGHAGRKLEHTLVMHEEWFSKLLGPGTATLLFKAGDRMRALDLGYRDGKLYGEICTDRTRDGGGFSSCSTDVGLSRPDRRTLRVTLSPRLLERGLSSYRWQAITYLNQGEGGCAELVCVDRLPEEGWVRHRL